MKNCSQLMLLYTNYTSKIFKNLDSNQDQENNFTGCVTLVEDLSKKIVQQCKLRSNEQNSKISELTKKLEVAEKRRNETVEQCDSKSNSNDSKISELTKKMDDAKSEFNKKLEDAKKRRYDGLSFFGGMLFVAAIAILSFFGLYYWKKQRSPNLPDYNYF